VHLERPHRQQQDLAGMKDEQPKAGKTVEELRAEAGWKPTGTVADYFPQDGLGFAHDSKLKYARASTHQSGVLYMGPWENMADGFAEHTRRCARALKMAGMPVHLRSGQPTVYKPDRRLGRDLRDELGDLLDESIHRYSAMVHQVVPSGGVLDGITTKEITAAARYKELRFTMEEQERINRGRIIYSVWERQDLHEAEVQALKRVGQVWVACQANLEMLQRHGIETGRVVPVPFMPDDPLLELEGRQRRRGPVRFYSIGKWEPRKEHRNLLGAFLREFEPGEAKLWLKTSPRAPRMVDYPSSSDEAVTQWLKDEQVIAKGWSWDNIQRFVHIKQAVLSPKLMLELHSIGDIYVSCSRGEGFDMPAFDAKLAGNLLVYTPSGGPPDFAGERDVRVVPSGTVQCHPFYDWGEARYLDYELDAVRDAMRCAWDTVRQGRACRGMDLEPFSAIEVGRRMRAYVEELAA
jgi:hypothetical protein